MSKGRIPTMGMFKKMLMEGSAGKKQRELPPIWFLWQFGIAMLPPAAALCLCKWAEKDMNRINEQKRAWIEEEEASLYARAEQQQKLVEQHIEEMQQRIAALEMRLQEQDGEREQSAVEVEADEQSAVESACVDQSNLLKSETALSLQVLDAPAAVDDANDDDDDVMHRLRQYFEPMQRVFESAEWQANEHMKDPQTVSEKRRDRRRFERLAEKQRQQRAGKEQRSH
jgi:hypothetical protein